jgi:hypothetical protein
VELRPRRRARARVDAVEEQRVKMNIGGRRLMIPAFLKCA